MSGLHNYYVRRLVGICLFIKKIAFAVLISILLGLTSLGYKNSEAHIRKPVIPVIKLLDDVIRLQFIFERINLTTYLIDKQNSNIRYEGSNGSVNNGLIPNYLSVQSDLVVLQDGTVFSTNAKPFHGVLQGKSLTDQQDINIFGTIGVMQSTTNQPKLNTSRVWLKQYSLIIQSIQNKVKAEPTWFYFQTWQEAISQSLHDLSEKTLAVIRDILHQVRGKQIYISNWSHKQHKASLSFSVAILTLIFVMLFFLGPFNKMIAISPFRRKVKKLSNIKLSVKESVAITAKKHELLTKVSHDICTPVNAMMQVTNLLAETKLDNKQQEYTKLLYSSGQFLLSMVQDILNFSKVTKESFTLEYSHFQLLTFLQDTVQMVAYSAHKKGIKLNSYFIAGTNRVVIGDQQRLRQILLNILQNAIKFTDQGQVAIYTNCRDSINEIVFFDCWIRDTGKGIPENNQRYVFDSFFQVDVDKNHNEGIGLGLSIASQLIKQMDGHIDLNSKSGVGSIFHFTVNLKKGDQDKITLKHYLTSVKTTLETPLIEEKNNPNSLSGSNQKKRAEASPIDGYIHQGLTNKAHILLIEDNEINRLATTRILKSLGHLLVTAENGFEVLEILSNVQFDLILMDCQLPEIDGLQTTRILRTHEQEINRLPIPIIALTAIEDPAKLEQCFEAGMNDLMQKSPSKEKLLRVIDCWYSSVTSIGDENNVDLDSNILQKLWQNQFLNEHFKNESEILTELFLTDTREKLRHLRESLHEKKRTDLSTQLHGIAGGCRQLGADKMLHSCKQLQNKFDSGSLEECDHLMNRLGYELLRIERLIEINKKASWDLV